MSMNDNPKRLLCIVSGMNAGGAETFLMKIYRALDKKKYQMDFYIAAQEEGFYEKEIISMGGKIYQSIPKSKNFIKSFNALRDTVKNENYDCVMRISQHSLSTIDLLAAKFGGAKILVQRSSNSATGGVRINRILHVLFKWLSVTIPNIKIAPSTEAAEYTFGKNCVKNRKAIIIKNAIPVENFLFNQARRDKIRKELNINDKFVVGHVGRFNNQKNHSFLIDIFAEIARKHENSVMVLVGKGELESAIKKKIDLLGMNDKVVFTGIRSDVPDIMMAMDVFVFPSFFEGMPNTVIEAQATGLPCLISDRITKEARITKVVTYMSLNDDARLWANRALEYAGGFDRENMQERFVENGYDINSVTREIENLIFTTPNDR